MAQLALGIMRSGNKLSVSVINRSYRQKNLKLSRTVSLTSDLDNQTDVVNEIVAFLSQIAGDENLKKARVAYCVGFDEFMWNIVEMPPVSRDDIRQILQFELDSHLPMAPDDCIFDAQIVASTPGMNSRVVLIGADKSVLEQCREISARVDIGLDAIAPATSAVIRTARSADTGETSSAPEIFLCADGDRYEVVVVQDGRFLTGRSVVSENPWKTDGGVTEDTDPSMDDVSTTILKNIQLALLTCNQSSSLDGVAGITCVGSFPDGVIAGLTQRLPAVDVQTFQIEGFFTGQTPYSEIAATCIAMQLFEDPEEMLNLVPPNLRPVRRETGRILIGAAAGVLASAMILVGANSYWSTELKILETDAHIATLESQVNQITDINRRFTSAQDARKFFMARSVDYPSQLDILLEVTRILPAEDTEQTKKVWLENFEIENHEMKIRGDSDSPEGLLNALEESTYFEGVKFDGTVSGTRFTIKATISKRSTIEESGFEGEAAAGTQEGTGVQGTATPDAKVTATPEPAPDADPDFIDSGDDDGDASEIPEESEEEEFVRGPAFPRTRPGDTMIGDEEGMQHTEPLSPEEQNALDEMTEEEDMEEMKKNLFDFIRERKEAADLDPDAHRQYEEQDPDEAAANFLEFLKAAADAEQGEGN